MAYTAKTTFAKIVLAKLRSILMVADTFNQKYVDDGNTIKIPVMDVEVAVGTYNPQTGKAITQGGNTYIDIIKNIDVAMNEMIDGKTASELSFSLKADRLDSAGYSLGLFWEKEAIKELETSGTASVIAEPTKSTIYNLILASQLALDNLLVPREGRILLIKPSMLPLLKNADGFMKTGDMSQEMVIKGTVGEIDGMSILRTTNFSDAKTRFVIYNPTWCHLAKGFKVEPTIKDLANEFIGSSAVQGRATGGVKVSRAAAVQVAKIA